MDCFEDSITKCPQTWFENRKYKIIIVAVLFVIGVVLAITQPGYNMLTGYAQPTMINIFFGVIGIIIATIFVALPTK